MLILTIRTDNPDAELGLHDNNSELAYIVWPAHRELAETIHIRMAELLKQCNKSLPELQGLVVYKGPGSFTGLRIGFSVGNALAYALGIPIVSTSKDNWREQGQQRLLAGDNEHIAVPEYGALPHITMQKK